MPDPPAAPDSADRDLLFAYGTLVRGGPPAIERAMSRHARRLGPATVAGRLFDAGAWPALTPAVDAADRVPGTLFEVLGPRELWPVLDAWEGCGIDKPRPHLFRRERAVARPDDGGSRNAWVYFYARELGPWPRIDRWPPATVSS